MARGIIADDFQADPEPFDGLVAPISHVDMVTAPRAGAILFDVAPGDQVMDGDRLATIVHAPGEEGDSTNVFAPQSGYILRRVSPAVPLMPATTW